MRREYSFYDPFFITLPALLVRAFLAFPQKPKCLWDVGSGSGKVCIEAKLRYGDVKLIAMDPDERCEEYMVRNMARHGVTPDAIDYWQQDILKMDLSTLARPDAIYVACAGSAAEDILPMLWEQLEPGGTIIASVSDQHDGKNEANNARVARLVNAHEKFGGTLSRYDTHFEFTRNQLHQKLQGTHLAHVDTKVHMIEWVGKKPA